MTCNFSDFEHTIMAHHKQSKQVYSHVQAYTMRQFSYSHTKITTS